MNGIQFDTRAAACYELIMCTKALTYWDILWPRLTLLSAELHIDMLCMPLMPRSHYRHSLSPYLLLIIYCMSN